MYHFQIIWTVILRIKIDSSYHHGLEKNVILNFCIKLAKTEHHLSICVTTRDPRIPSSTTRTTTCTWVPVRKLAKYWGLVYRSASVLVQVVFCYRLCDNKGPTVAIFYNTDNNVYGGTCQTAGGVLGIGVQTNRRFCFSYKAAINAGTQNQGGHFFAQQRFFLNLHTKT